MNSLLDIKKNMLQDPSINVVVREWVGSIGRDPKRPLGKFNPWAWWIELVRGCNLRCYHCPTRLFPPKFRAYMKRDVWVSLLEVVQEVTPYTRIEFGQAGEPTLHPEMLDFLSLARQMCPNIQLMTYTNGTQLISGKVTYKELFDAGLNTVFVDMYSSLEDHKALAEESGYYWYYEDDKPKDAPNVFAQHNDPDTHIIRLSNTPANWSKRKKARRNGLQTFFNDLDWECASKHGMVPSTDAPKRRCDFPTKFISVNHDGTFLFCCFDFMRHTVEQFGTIRNGVEDFIRFWLGEYMQDTRKKVLNNDRAAHEWCRICQYTSIRCDIPWFGGQLSEKDLPVLDLFWDGNRFQLNDKYQKQVTLTHTKEEMEAEIDWYTKILAGKCCAGCGDEFSGLIGYKSLCDKCFNSMLPSKRKLFYHVKRF